MTTGFRVFFLVFWLILTFLCALLLFTKGFLLKRIVVGKHSDCEPAHWLLNNLQNGLRTKIRLQTEIFDDKDGCNHMTSPTFSKAVLVIIDGLRYDFLQYHHNIDAYTALPFQNKMKKLHQILEEQHGHAKLFKFEADPPTTTMQRIKGITTGSLPTFVDAGTNFDSSAIVEDNVLDHVVRKGKNISFMGCSTWTELFPKQFHRKIPFSALNVKDLDTIDYGIIRNIYNEIKRPDWSLMIAHFLGVDHCGHRYGTHHPEMTRKLTEMDTVISDLTKSIDDDTVLFVMGDHGMTMSGDHGGDSADEVMAGLFAYSKKQIFSRESEDHEVLPKVSQIDLVPTLSLMLGIPIPFSNLGTIIPHFFDGDKKSFLPDFLKRELYNKMNWDTVSDGDAERIQVASQKLFKNINLAYVSYINCKQVLAYLDEYQKVATDLPSDQIENVRASFAFVEERFEENLEDLVLHDWLNKTLTLANIASIEEDINEIYYLHLSFQNVLLSFKTICRSIWAKFDILSMSLGLSLMMFVSIAVCFTPMIIIPSSITDPGKLGIVVYLVGFCFSLVGIMYLALPFEDVDMSSVMTFAAASFSFSLWLLSCGSSTLLFIHQHLSRNKLKAISSKHVLYITCLVIYLGSLFSNSYIVHEDTSTLFLCQSFILFHFFYGFVAMLEEQKRESKAKMNKTRNFTYLRTRILQSITSKNMLKNYLYVLAVMVSLRSTRYFWFCRETQLKCNISPYSLPLVSLLSEFTEGYAHERLFVAYVSIIALTVATYYFVKSRGNMKGNSSAVFVVKLSGSLIVLILVLHWSLQVKLTDEISNKLIDVPYVQQIVLPRIVYALFIISLIYLVCKPINVYVIHRGKKNRVNRIVDTGNVVDWYKLLKEEHSNTTNPEDSKPPIVYGMQTIYSAAFFCLLYIVTMVATMVLTDGLAFPVTMLWIAAFCYSRFFSLETRNGLINNSDMVIPIVVWSFFASLGFFSTGHQTAISTIRFYAAYIGFKGSVQEIIPQVMVILFNTFCSQVICALALPMFLVLKRLSFSPSSDEENEYMLMDYPDVSRINLFKMMILYLGTLMLKVSFTAASASLHRRHLMVWKIFGPRFMFEAVGFMVTAPMILLGYCFYIRVDNKLRKFTVKLDKEIS